MGHPNMICRQTSIAKPLSISKCNLVEKHFRTCSFWFSSCRAFTRSWWQWDGMAPTSHHHSHHFNAKNQTASPRAPEAAFMVIDQNLNTQWMCLIFRIAKVEGSFHLHTLHHGVASPASPAMGQGQFSGTG